jgi:hypothetical protein
MKELKTMTLFSRNYVLYVDKFYSSKDSNMFLTHYKKSQLKDASKRFLKQWIIIKYNQSFANNKFCDPVTEESWTEKDLKSYAEGIGTGDCKYLIYTYWYLEFVDLLIFGKKQVLTLNLSSLSDENLGRSLFVGLTD